MSTLNRHEQEAVLAVLSETANEHQYMVFGKCMASPEKRRAVEVAAVVKERLEKKEKLKEAGKSIGARFRGLRHLRLTTSHQKEEAPAHPQS